MRETKFILLALFIALAVGVLAGSASADYKTKISLVVPNNASWLSDEAYVMTVPADLEVKASGWNSLGVIHVHHATDSRDHFDTDKKLVVTVTASNDFKLTSGTNTISYTFGKTKDSEDKSFEFTAASIDAGTSIDVGITVEAYTGKPAGTYEDYITFKAEVQDVSADASTENTIQQYYDKLTAVTYDSANETWSFMTGNDTDGYSFNGQTLTSEQAIELAQSKAAETGKSCAVIYSVADGWIDYAKSDGDTGYSNMTGLAIALNTMPVYYAAK